MEPATAHLAQLATTSQHFVRRPSTIAENPLGLLMVEVPGERERLWHANRVRMQEEWQAMTDGVRRLADRAKSFGSIASSAAVLVAGLPAFRRGQPVDADAKPSRRQTILKGAGLISTLWLAFRSRGRDQKDKWKNRAMHLVLLTAAGDVILCFRQRMKSSNGCGIASQQIRWNFSSVGEVCSATCHEPHSPWQGGMKCIAL